MEDDSDCAGPARHRTVTKRYTLTTATPSPSPWAIQRNHTARLPDKNDPKQTPTVLTTPLRSRRRRREACCGSRMRTSGGSKHAVHALAWVLGGAALWGGEGATSVGTLNGGKNAMALVQHPAGSGLAATKARLPRAWEGGMTSRAGGAIRRPTEFMDSCTRLWGRGNFYGNGRDRDRRPCFPGGGLERRGFVSHTLTRYKRCDKANKANIPREMGGQGFASTSPVCSSDGAVNKKRSTGRAASKRRRRTRPLVEQRGVKAAEAEREASSTIKGPPREGETDDADVDKRLEDPGLTGMGSVNCTEADASMSAPTDTAVKIEQRGARTVRMRKFLPAKERHDRDRNNFSKKKSAGEVDVDEEAKNESAEAQDVAKASASGGTVEVQLLGAAAARKIVIAAESASWGERSEEEKATAGGSGSDDGGKDEGSNRRIRKCPPAVGFVSGFRDIRLDGSGRGAQGEASSSFSGGSGGDARVRSRHNSPPGVEALIRALSDPLKSATAPQHAAAPRRRANQSFVPGISVGKREVANDQAGGVGVAKVDARGGRASGGVGDGAVGGSASSVKQKKTKPQPDATQSYVSHTGGTGPRGDEHLRIDPPTRSVSINFDPKAGTLLSCITTNTNAYGEALHAPTAEKMSRADLAAYLERWLLVSIKHGVAPRELRALLHENQGSALGFGASGGAARRGDGVGIGREAGFGPSSTAGTHHGSSDRGRWGDTDASADGSWTKYGWKRLDHPPDTSRAVSGGSSSSSSSETVEDRRMPSAYSEDESLTHRESRGPWSSSFTPPRGHDIYGECEGESDAAVDGGSGVLESEGDEEVEEEEMMESVAEALVGGDGGREADDGWSIRGAASPEAERESVAAPAAASTSAPSDGHAGAVADARHLYLLEENNFPGIKAGGASSGNRSEEGEEGDIDSGEGKWGRNSSLGWRVLETVEARFKSGLHPPRIIAIGDVHGCLDELKDLVRKVEYWPGDLLLFLGDLVAKGPHSAGVVRLARELEGVTVRGNHEFEVLRWLNVDVQEDGRAPSPHHKIALSLSEEDGTWLKASPWYFRCDDLGSLFVHAGFASGVNMNKQNPRMMMNMRSVSASGLITSKVLETSPWARHWTGPDTVFFGHDAERGLQLLDHAVGLDTGCVYGGRLTACILPERRLVSVASRAAYMAYGKRRGSSGSSGRSSNGNGDGSNGNGDGNDLKVKNRRSYGRHRSS